MWIRCILALKLSLQKVYFSLIQCINFFCVFVFANKDAVPCFFSDFMCHICIQRYKNDVYYWWRRMIWACRMWRKASRFPKSLVLGRPDVLQGKKHLSVPFCTQPLWLPLGQWEGYWLLWFWSSYGLWMWQQARHKNNASWNEFGSVWSVRTWEPNRNIRWEMCLLQ